MTDLTFPMSPLDRITAVDFHRSVGETADRARQRPVTITKHGRPYLVLVSAEEFQRLTAASACPAGIANPGQQ